MISPRVITGIALLTTLPSFPTSAYDVTDTLSIDATVTGVYQWGEFSGANVDDIRRGTLVADIGVDFHPTERDRFQFVASVAAGNALNAVSPYAAHPLYADDLEDDLRDINGRGRDHLLIAWYKHTFVFSEDAALGFTGGIIDATAYVDDNAFANDEVSQFMNEAFVNNTLMVPPSFDTGIAGELDIGPWSLRGVWMRVGDPDVGKPDKTYDYWGKQVGLRVESAWGEGNYRLGIQGASDDFADPAGARYHALFGVGLSMDQELGENFGAFARLGWQKDDAAIDHDALYSGGIRLDGSLWERTDDEAGLGYARLSGGNGNVRKTDIMEGYIKFRFSEYIDLSLDIQYLDERLMGQDDPSGFVYGARLNTHF
uniref:Porin n=1 Tax=Candidatus Kentrum sp. SD TaxID=2126332 RepID=A0A451BMQ5_9GAMM|nr:MAG: porin [Candidatus Kentron sp. SD]VFK43530.1 MAG: porin [Candidatus Kentron sp. SD]VFK79585.1 MAG: porin [Candidatus Kentron sp. SD]